MNIKDVDLNLLLIFDQVYRDRNMSKASKALAMTQPAVSNALSRLAKTLGQPLFVRAGHGVAPTPHAEAIAPEVATALGLLRNALTGSAFDPRHAERRFTLVCSDYSASIILPLLLQRVREQAPQTVLEVVNLREAQDFASALAQGEADLALGALRFLGGPLRQQKLLDDRIVVLARRGHPAAEGKAGADLVGRYPHVLASPYGNWASIEELAARRGIRLRVAIRVTSYFAVPFLLEQGDYLAVCPQRLAAVLTARFPLVALASDVAPNGIAIGQYWHERSQQDPGHQWLRQQVAEVCRGL